MQDHYRRILASLVAELDADLAPAFHRRRGVFNGGSQHAVQLRRIEFIERRIVGPFDHRQQVANRGPVQGRQV